MKYFIVEPEVAGGLGPSSIIEPGTHPPIIHKLEYRFEGWLGSHIIESFPICLASDVLLRELRAQELTGFTEDNVTVTFSEEFQPSASTQKMPSFKWLKIVGQMNKDDFFLADDQRLVISENAKMIIESIGGVNWGIEVSTVHKK